MAGGPKGVPSHGCPPVCREPGVVVARPLLLLAGGDAVPPAAPPSGGGQAARPLLHHPPGLASLVYSQRTGSGLAVCCVQSERPPLGYAAPEPAARESTKAPARESTTKAPARAAFKI